MNIAQAIADASNGRAQLVFQEDDNSTQKVDSAHFIKIDNQRVGRDIEMYVFFGDLIRGWPTTLCDFLNEVLIPIRKAGLTESYTAGADLLRKFGQEIFPAKYLQDWDNLLI